MRTFAVALPALLTVAATAAAAWVPPPPPPPPRPVLVAGPGADEPQLETVRGLLAAYFGESGHGASEMPAERFAGCFDDAAAEGDCLRARLREWRAEAGEVTIAVLVEPAAGGGVRLVCLGGSRNGAWLDETRQKIDFAADVDPTDPMARDRAETCVGRAFGEYMVP